MGKSEKTREAGETKGNRTSRMLITPDAILLRTAGSHEVVVGGCHMCQNIRSDEDEPATKYAIATS